MITLPATSYIAGIASVAAKLTTSIFGLEPSGVGYGKLYQAQLPTAAGALYTAPTDGPALIREIMVVNTDSSARTFALYVDGTDDAHKITPTVTLLAGGFATYDGRWAVYDSNGALQSSGGGGGGALTDHTHAATGSGATGGGATLSPTTLILPQGTATTQTAEGSVAWDTDDDFLAIGDGAATRKLYPDPFTTRGDILVRSATVPTRKALGAVNTFLESDGTDPQWRTRKGFEGSCTAQAISNNADDPIEWTESTDTDAFHAGTSNAIVIPAGLAGWYAISASVVFSTGGTARRMTIKNGATEIAHGVDGTSSAQRSATWIGKLAVSDSITIVVLGNAAGITVDAQVGLIFLGA